ncbi:MAG: hypothetical protein ACK5AZ_04480 [Bryobacteraceae bacterium]
MRTLLSVFTGLLLCLAPASAIDKRCGAANEAAGYLKDIAYEASKVKHEAESLRMYLQNASVDRVSVVWKLGMVEDGARKLRNLISRFEARELELTPAQRQELERMKAGVATLTVFLNNTYRTLADNGVVRERQTLQASASAIAARSQIIRDAARNIRTAEIRLAG